jgi:hypothetical protein
MALESRPRRGCEVRKAVGEQRAGRKSGLSFKPRGELKQGGVGPAAAVLIDATLIRGVLFAATIGLLGDWNRYLPRRSHWLPGSARKRAQLRAEAEPTVPRSQPMTWWALLQGLDAASVLQAFALPQRCHRVPPS